MTQMAMGPQRPENPLAPGRPGRREVAVVAGWCAALFAGSLLLGLAGGAVWGECAPRVLMEEFGAGTAGAVHAETRAYFGADVWFAGLAALAGLLAGLAGYRFAVARRDGYARAALTAALIAGAIGGSLVMMWLGGQFGLSAYHHQLAVSPDGAQFAASLSLGSKSALALWPLVTSAVLLIAEWSRTPDPVGD